MSKKTNWLEKKTWLLGILPMVVGIGLVGFYLWAAIAPYLVSQSVQTFSDFDLPLRCSINGRQEYLVVLEARHQIRDRVKGAFGIDRSLDFGEPIIVCTDSKGHRISMQNFRDVPLFPGNRLTFKLLAGLWLDVPGVEPITLTVSQLSSRLPNPKISVFPWGKNVRGNFSIAPFVAQTDLRSGEQLKRTDFGPRIVAPIPNIEDLGGVNRALFEPSAAFLPAIGLSNPTGFTCSRNITKWQVLTTKDLVLPTSPSKIEATIRNQQPIDDAIEIGL